MNNKKRRWVDVNRVSSKFKSKKGQITVFIILGILILLALVLLILFRKEVIISKPDEVILTESGKVENFITTCMDQIGDDALYIIGLQGGYIDVPPELADASLSLRVSPMNVVPYWAYGKNTNIPPLLEIKDRIDIYMQDNLRNCLFEMEAFQESYDLIEKSGIVSDTQILDAKIIFNVHWNIEVKDKAGEVISEVINHQSESPVKLKRLRELAERITLKELESLKLEDITQDLIALEHPDVPVAGIDLSCSKKTWKTKVVEETLLELLRVNIKQLKVSGTELIDFPDIYYPELKDGLTYYENHYVLDLGTDYDYPDTSVIFNFDTQFPYTFAVTPVSGSKMKSSQLGGSAELSFVCIQTWKFTYDLVYPVIVRVRDETTGYIFNFAFTVHLLQNNPDRGQISSRPPLITPTENSEAYCNNRNVPMTVRTYEFVDNGEGVSYKEDLGDVELSFSCLKYGCELENTEYDFNNLGYAGIITNFPYCVGGILRGNKENYKETWTRVVTENNQEVELNLIPVISVPRNKIKVYKHQFVDPLTIGPAEEIDNGEIALIKLGFSGTNDTEMGLTHEVNFVESKDIDPELKENDKIEFLANADYNYFVDISFIDEDSFIGGYKGLWNAPWTALKSAEEIAFHVLVKENPSEYEMAELLLSLEEYSINVPSPEIK